MLWVCIIFSMFPGDFIRKWDLKCKKYRFSDFIYFLIKKGWSSRSGRDQFTGSVRWGLTNKNKFRPDDLVHVLLMYIIIFINFVPKCIYSCCYFLYHFHRHFPYAGETIKTYCIVIVSWLSQAKQNKYFVSCHMLGEKRVGR